MKSVVLKSSIVILFIFLFSCHKTVLNSKKSETIVAKEKVNKLDSIITDSNDPNFIYDLIMTQKVSIGDTVLFREWTGLAKKTITIYSDKVGFKMFTDTISKFYKTGEIKFSKNEITVLNTLSNEYFKINAFAIIDNDLDDAYDMNRPTSYLTIKKTSKTEGVFDFSSPLYEDYFMTFIVKNNAVHITKLINMSYSAGQYYRYDLDTLITLRNNGRIYPDSLRSIICKEKNRIPVKVPKDGSYPKLL
jgi:hypothetical protein